MDKLTENRYELILGFATVIISLSAFKDELGAIYVDLVFFKFSLSQYLLCMILGITVSFYVYSLERILNSLSYTQARIVSILRNVAYFIFILFLLSPFAILILWAISKTSINKTDVINVLTTSFICGGIGGIAGFILEQLLARRKVNQLRKLEDKEIVEIETTLSLFEKGFYSQSIIESIRVLETHLVKILRERNIEVKNVSLLELLKYSVNKNLVTKEEFEQMDQYRQLRNAAAHIASPHNKEDAEKVLEFVKGFLAKSIKPTM